MARVATDEAERLARELIENQRKLEKIAETEKITQEAARMRAAQRKDIETLRHHNKVDDNPCL